MSETGTAVITHKCPNCGGALTFEPSDQSFHCPYCLSVFTEEEVTAFEEKQQQTKNVGDASSVRTKEEPQDTDGDGVDDLGLFVCPNCGAEIVTETTTAATSCYFCHNPIVLTDRLSGEFTPEKVIPFEINRKEAEAKFLEWTAKKKFVPKAFFNKESIKNLSGVYFPYFHVDSTVQGTLTAQATNVRVWMVGDTEYTETKQYQVSRSGVSNFKDYIRNALKKNETKKMVEAIQPFDFSKAIDFKNQYLSGFLAEKRDIEFEEMKPQVEKDMKDYGLGLLEDTIQGYTTVSNVTGQLQVTDTTSSYMLLPVWIVTYRDKASDKLYFYAMNGQSGKTAGILPVSRGRLVQTSILLFIFILIVGLIVGWMV